jgi:hypothetical protein
VKFSFVLLIALGTALAVQNARADFGQSSTTPAANDVPLLGGVLFRSGNSFQSGTSLGGYAFYTDENGAEHADPFNKLQWGSGSQQHDSLQWPCMPSCSGAPSVAAYTLGVAPGLLKAGAVARSDDQSSSSMAKAELGDFIHLNNAAVVHFHGHLDGPLWAAGPNGGDAMAAVTVGVNLWRPGSVTATVSSPHADSLGSYSFNASMTGDGHDIPADIGSLNVNTEDFDYSVLLPAGNTFVDVGLGVQATGASAWALADFSHTLRLSIDADPAAGLSSVAGLLPVGPVPGVPEPSTPLLSLAGVLAIARRWHRSLRAEERA